MNFSKLSPCGRFGVRAISSLSVLFVLLLQSFTLHNSVSADELSFLTWEEDAGLPGYARSVQSGTLTGTGLANRLSFLFDVETGDRYSFYLEAVESSGVPQLRILNATGTAVATVSGTAGTFARIISYEALTPGTYTVDVYFNTQPGNFHLMSQRARTGVQLEIEPNGTRATATNLRMQGSGGVLNLNVAGLIDSFESEDYYDLGILGSGAQISVTHRVPAGSNIQAGDLRISLWNVDDPTPVAVTQTSPLQHTVTTAGRYYVSVDLPGPEHFLVMDGGGWVDLGNPEALRITGDQTIEFWVKPANLSTRRNPWAKAYGGEGTMTIETNGTVNYFYGTNGGNGNPYQTFTNPYPLPAGVWTHLALVRDLSGAPATLRWYVNGRLWRSEPANLRWQLRAVYPPLSGRAT